ncbi:MAG: PH domain-containing protein [Bacteroidales bacterium]|nr:PH domain-containing protein [Candidatus Sodaliphilus aphodohippi]
MKTVYRTKVDLWLIILMVALVVFMVVMMFALPFEWSEVVGLLLLLFMFVQVFVTSYTIEGDTLTVSFGKVYINRYDIGNLMFIRQSRTLISAPAASIDRLELYFSGTRRPVIVSPKQQREFVVHLLKINPDARYEERK